MGYKTFGVGEEALAADVNNYLMSQTVARFTTAAQRTALLPSPVFNQLSMRDDRPGGLERWNGSAWVDISEIVYTQITTQVAISNSSAAVSQQVIPASSIVYDGSPIMIEFYAVGVLTPNVAGGHIMFNLFDGVTDLGYMGQMLTTAPVLQSFASMRRRIVPSPGSHSYQITAWLPTGGGQSGQVYAGAGGSGLFPPAFMRITRA